MCSILLLALWIKYCKAFFLQSPDKNRQLWLWNSVSSMWEAQQKSCQLSPPKEDFKEIHLFITFYAHCWYKSIKDFSLWYMFEIQITNLSKITSFYMCLFSLLNFNSYLQSTLHFFFTWSISLEVICEVHCFTPIAVSSPVQQTVIG